MFSLPLRNMLFSRCFARMGHQGEKAKFVFISNCVSFNNLPCGFFAYGSDVIANSAPVKFFG